MAQPKDVVRRFLHEIVSDGGIEAADELVADDLTFTSPYTQEPTTERGAFVGLLSAIHAAFPDFSLDVEKTLAEGDLVASRWVSSGTHTGPAFNGLPAGSGLAFRTTGMSIYRVRDGRIVEGWLMDDTLAMAAQLGLVPVPAPVA